MTRAATPPAAPRQRARALHPPSSSRAPAAPARHRRRRGLWVGSAGRTCAAPFLILTKSTSDSFVTLARSGVFLLAEHHWLETRAPPDPLTATTRSMPATDTAATAE